MTTGQREFAALSDNRSYEPPGYGRADNPCGPEARPLDQLQPHLATSRWEARPVLRSPKSLRLHPALDKPDLIDVVGELNEATRLKDQPAAEPILTTTSGTILTGFGRWRLAIFEGRHEVNCIEYSLSENESLQFILAHHQPRRGWNAFIRICLALTLEPSLQQKALDKMRLGGRYKGSANLPEAQQIDVRQEIAQTAGVGARNVSNVKAILQTAHARLIEALRDGTITINRAIHWCRLPKDQQVEQFTRHGLERATSKVIRQSIARPGKEKTSLDLLRMLDALWEQEARQPGSVLVRTSRIQRTVILVGEDLLTGLHSQGKLNLA